MPIVMLDGQPVGNGGPGTVATALRAAYEAHAATHATGHPDWQAPFLRP
jgi:hypothetical protein